MANDHGQAERRQWLRAIARRRTFPMLRRLVTALGASLRPASRRRRALLRATLVRT